MTTIPNGYTTCACHDCSELAFGSAPINLCHVCEEAGCDDHPNWPECRCAIEPWTDDDGEEPGGC